MVGRILRRLCPVRSKTSDGTQNSFRSTIIQWIQLLIPLSLPLAIGLFTVITTIQNRQIAQQQRDADKTQAEDGQRETVFTNYINEISRYRDENNDKMLDISKMLYVRAKTLTILRDMDEERKKNILRFLYESWLLSNIEINVMRGADFDRIKVHNEECAFMDAYLDGASFQDSSFTQCIFRRSRLTQIDFRGADLARSVFGFSNLTDCRLDNANLQSAIIRSVTFTSTSLSYVNFRGAKLDEVQFHNVNLTGAVLDHPRQLEQMAIRNSLLPDGSLSSIDGFHLNISGHSLTSDALTQLQTNETIEQYSSVQSGNQAMLSYTIFSPVASHSMLVNANQAEFELAVYHNGTAVSTSVVILFTGVERGVYETNRRSTFSSIGNPSSHSDLLDCSSANGLACSYALPIPVYTQRILVRINVNTVGASLQLVSNSLRARTLS